MIIRKKGLFVSSTHALSNGASMVVGGAVFLLLGLWVIYSLYDGALDLGIIGDIIVGPNSLVLVMDDMTFLILSFVLLIAPLALIGAGAEDLYYATRSKAAGYDSGEKLTISYISISKDIAAAAIYVEDHTCPSCKTKITGPLPKFCPECAHGLR
jgi:hypothetical protein